MVTKVDIVEVARSLLGTPWKHQGRNPSHGLDCAGLLVEVARRLGLDISGIPADYPKRPPSTLLDDVSGRLCERVKYPDIGDVAVFKLGRRCQHAAILTGAGYMIHARQGVGVVETPLSTWALRLSHGYRFPGVG